MKIAEQLLNENSKNVISVGPEITVYETIRIMVENRIGAVLIMQNDEILGIWTERDYLRNTVADGFNPYTTKIKVLMNRNIHYAKHDDNIFQLMDKFLGLRIRHLPIRKEGKFLGMLSSGDIQKELLKGKDEELNKIKKVLSWEYYENWKW